MLWTPSPLCGGRPAWEPLNQSSYGQEKAESLLPIYPRYKMLTNCCCPLIASRNGPLSWWAELLARRPHQRERHRVVVAVDAHMLLKYAARSLRIPVTIALIMGEERSPSAPILRSPVLEEFIRGGEKLKFMRPNAFDHLCRIEIFISFIRQSPCLHQIIWTSCPLQMYIPWQQSFVEAPLPESFENTLWQIAMHYRRRNYHCDRCFFHPG